MTSLVCSRCGAPITKSYERGRCVAADCEVSVHDRAAVPFVGLDEDDRQGLAAIEKMQAERSNSS